MEIKELNLIIRSVEVNDCQRNQKVCCIKRIQEATNRAVSNTSYWTWAYTQVTASSGEMINHLMQGDQGGEWAKRYADKEYFNIDPIVRAAQYHSGIYRPMATWHDCYVNARNKPLGDNSRQRTQYLNDLDKYQKDAADYGFVSGLAINKRIGLQQMCVTLVSRESPQEHDKRVNKENLQLISAAITIISSALDDTLGCDFCHPQKAYFTPSDSESKWLYAILGNPLANNEELARQAGLSINTLNKQLNSIRTGLGLPGVNPLALAIYCLNKGLLPLSQETSYRKL